MTEIEGAPRPAPIGERIVVVGSSCSGKSTLAEALGERLSLPYVELDALFWRPNWQEPPDDEFRAALLSATDGERWVVAGNYLRHTMPVVWPRADTVVWLDLPLPTVTWRVLRRSWRRWRTNELLWGTNHERFWDQLKLWDTRHSLIAFNVKNHRRRRHLMEAAMRHPHWSETTFVRLRTSREVAAFLEGQGALSVPAAG